MEEKTSRFLDCRWKLENLRRTCTDTGRTINSMQKDPTTFWLGLVEASLCMNEKLAFFFSLSHM